MCRCRCPSRSFPSSRVSQVRLLVHRKPHHCTEAQSFAKTTCQHVQRVVSWKHVVCSAAGSLGIAWNYGGSVSAVWGWVVVGVMTTMVGLAMAEIVSALPSSGVLPVNSCTAVLQWPNGGLRSILYNQTNTMSECHLGLSNIA